MPPTISGAIFEFGLDGSLSTSVTLPYPVGLAFDTKGNLFAAGSVSGNIYEITPSGSISTFASGLNIPEALAFDSKGNLFEADAGSGTIYKFTPSGDRSIFANGLNEPVGLAFDSSGNLFESDFGSDTIYKFTPKGTGYAYILPVLLSGPRGLAFDESGDLFEANYYSGTICEITPDFQVSTFASGLDHPFGIAFAPSVPEPSTFVLLAAGAVGLLGFTWRRRRKVPNLSSMILVTLVVLAAGWARADVFSMPTGQTSLDFVTVGDPGNAASSTGYGAVAYSYDIGKYDVTVAQYTTFLNSVATTGDPYGLYNTWMAGSYGCGIERSRSAGSYTYSVLPGWGNMPVNYVSWGDAARFCNWLDNGQPVGSEGPSTTEAGAYTLNGGTSLAALMAVTRNAGATYFIPSENEWYKAAYYKGGSSNAGYWTYPTKSNTAPVNILSLTGPNNANFYDENHTGNGGTTPIRRTT